LTVNQLVYGFVTEADRKLTKSAELFHPTSPGPFDGPEPLHESRPHPTSVFLPRCAKDELSSKIAHPEADLIRVLTKKEREHMSELESVQRNTLRAINQSASTLPTAYSKVFPQSGTAKPEKIIRTVTPARRAVTPARRASTPAVSAISQVALPSSTENLIGMQRAPPVEDEIMIIAPSADTPAPQPQQREDYSALSTIERPSRFSARHKFNIEPTVQSLERKSSSKLHAKGSSGPLRKNFFFRRVNENVRDIALLHKTLGAKEVLGEPSPNAVRSIWKGDKDSSVQKCIRPPLK
jgi:hypothetical protein